MSRSKDGIYRVSNSEMKTWKRCKRKWWLAYNRQLGPLTEKATGPLPLGTRVHLALATYYGGNWDSEEALTVYKTDAQEALDRMIESDPFADTKKFISDMELGRIMLEGYFEWIEETGADEGLSVISPETPVEAPLQVEGDKVHIRGKLDLRIRREFDGARLFLDHKTAASLNQANHTITMDPQMKMYHLLEKLEAWAIGADENAERTDGGIYSMLRKVKRTERAKPPFYDRIEIRHNDETLRNFYVEVHGIAMEMLRAEDLLARGTQHHYVVPPNPTRDCSWDCEFFQACPMFDDGSRAEDFISNYFQVVDPDARYVTDEKLAKGTSPE